MNHTFFLVAAYILLWLAVFGYVWNIFQKQKSLAREVENIKNRLAEKEKSLHR